MTRTTAPSLAPPSWMRGQPLRLEGVRFARDGTEILRGVDLRMEPGRRSVILGPSGAGKSTLLRLLNRLQDPSSGRIVLGDVPITAFPVNAVREHVALVFQEPRPLPGSVLDNLAYSHRVRKRTIPPLDDLSAMLEQVGLNPDWLDRDASALSGGERQKLAIASAMAIGPEILAMDEPTSALDPASARRVADWLAHRCATTGLRTLAVCHHRGHAAWLGDEGIVMERGVVIDQGPIAEVLARNEIAHGEDSP